MGCKSASVQRAQDKSEEAFIAINDLEESVNELTESEVSDFEAQIESFQNRLGVDDMKDLESNTAVKIDFTHEFDVDALIPVISDVLNAAATLVKGVDLATTITNPKNLKTYADLLTSIAESIKTKSDLGANTTYSMNRLAPGFFVFTCTKTKSIKDKQTFGEESVTATFFAYRISFSLQHAKQISNWTRILSLFEIIKKFSEARIRIVDKLVGDELTMAEFNAMSDYYKSEIDRIQIEIESEMKVTKVEVVNETMDQSYSDENVDAMSVLTTKTNNNQILKDAIKVLKDRSSLYGNALQEATFLLHTLNR